MILTRNNESEQSWKCPPPRVHTTKRLMKVENSNHQKVLSTHNCNQTLDMKKSNDIFREFSNAEVHQMNINLRKNKTKIRPPITSIQRAIFPAHPLRKVNQNNGEDDDQFLENVEGEDNEEQLLVDLPLSFF
ncbi:hypothetical protein VP01_618g1 [Puccinia sorghi]|uniref:Uncharacterized protein n=1 Tax=Puccinia sorghi TaxID=27349 RepID=A0A0L6UGR7_9BASI|nr:hypothetical protein VP01_618g1 [Puccinia sorghi]